ncbi:MAG: hypothetical protein JW798_15440 [Prolixibacteraceae bacterium]|nr:hypothetical protein [Prolixibacteraceae bacterium]
MKNSSKILVGILIVISLAIGFIIGLLVDIPQAEEEALSGTIGRINNYRDVKVTENDIKLRSELMASDHLLKQYQLYFSYHYASAIELGKNIQFAIDASKSNIDFTELYPQQINALSKYYRSIEQARKDVLIALSTLQNLDESNERNIGNLINNANVAIAQIKYRENVVVDFVEAVEDFIAGNKDVQCDDLKKAHDLLAIHQAVVAAIYKDKPMTKYYNKKEIFSSKQELEDMEWNNSEPVASQVDSDIDIANDQVGVFDQSLLDATTNLVQSAVDNIQSVTATAACNATSTLDNTSGLDVQTCLDTNQLDAIISGSGDQAEITGSNVSTLQSSTLDAIQQLDDASNSVQQQLDAANTDSSPLDDQEGANDGEVI